MRSQLSRLTAARRARAVAACALMLSAAFAMPAIAAAADSPAPTIQVEITRFAFAPREITVAPGDRIIWTNRDEAPHTVTSDDRSFASKGLDTGDSFEHTFSGEGDFRYICTVHPFMTGMVHVRKR